MTDPFATPAGFRAWLEKHKPAECVGYRNDHYESAEARYLRAQGYEGAFVGAEMWHCYGEHAGDHNLPGWVYRFVLACDRNGDGTSRGHGPLTQAEALDILSTIEAGLETAGIQAGLVAGAPAGDRS